ncbi:hypothetical protein [Paenibacillus sp. GCM10028914]|uniref:hypothetical protein n=1 Tax=Paenibacillus sp. GCM10028914 TaxID=3273416 RepID=UPI00361AF1FA
MKNKSGKGSGSDNSYQQSIMYEPFPVLPQAITIRPYVRNDDEKVYIPELEFDLRVQ